MGTSNTYVVKDCSDYRVAIEMFEGFVFLHCEVFKSTPRVIRELQKLFTLIKDWCFYMGASRLCTYTPNPKFATLMSGGFNHEFNYAHNGVEYEVYEWQQV